jgi:hypothetical protein
VVLVGDPLPAGTDDQGCPDDTPTLEGHPQLGTKEHQQRHHRGLQLDFQASKAKARGYKRFDAIRSIICLLTSKLDFSKINPYCATHSF